MSLTSPIDVVGQAFSLRPLRSRFHEDPIFAVGQAFGLADADATLPATADSPIR